MPKRVWSSPLLLSSGSASPVNAIIDTGLMDDTLEGLVSSGSNSPRLSPGLSAIPPTPDLSPAGSSTPVSRSSSSSRISMSSLESSPQSPWEDVAAPSPKSSSSSKSGISSESSSSSDPRAPPATTKFYTYKRTSESRRTINKNYSTNGNVRKYMLVTHSCTKEYVHQAMGGVESTSQQCPHCLKWKISLCSHLRICRKNPQKGKKTKSS